MLDTISNWTRIKEELHTLPINTERKKKVICEGVFKYPAQIKSGLYMGSQCKIPAIYN